jgi:Ohr subfamily peroxiredoxin
MEATHTAKRNDRMAALYTTTARAAGGRAGHVETDDGLFSADLAMPRELGGPGGATNPEQLFAAGYAACFESSIRFLAGRQKLPLRDASVTATVQILPTATGAFQLAVALRSEVEGLDQAAAEALVHAADQVCPYSNAVRGNVDVTHSVQASA